MSVCSGHANASRVDVLGVPIDMVTVDEALDALDEFLSCPGTHVMHHIPVDPIVRALEDASYMEILRRGDLNLPDGQGVLWGAGLLNLPKAPQRIPGAFFMERIARWGHDRRLKHAFIGGQGDVLDRLIKNLKDTVDGFIVTGAYSPPFREVSPETVREDLDALGAEADVLWVGLGTPKQQMWAEWSRLHNPAHVVASVGAAFDFIAGVKRQAPRWMADSGLEWAYRLASEPRRLWRRYLVGNTKFIAAVARARARSEGTR